MKIRGNTVGTTLKPEKVIVKCQNLTEVEKAQVRENIGAVGTDDIRYMQDTLTGLDGNVSNLLDSVQDVSDRVTSLENGGSGGASALIVVAADGEETSHSADDIYHHVRNGGTATLSYNGRYYNLLSVTEDEYAWFGYIDDGGSAHIVGILGSEVEPYEQTYATESVIHREIEASKKWKLLDTFDLSSGAVSYSTDTTGCTELMVVTTATATGSGQAMTWKGVAMSEVNQLAVGSVRTMTHLSNGKIAYQTARGNTDTLQKSGIVTGANANDNTFVLKFSSVSAGTIDVWGR